MYRELLFKPPNDLGNVEELEPLALREDEVPGLDVMGSDIEYEPISRPKML